MRIVILQLRSHRTSVIPFLGEDARFVTIPQYPPFCWTELIVNAVAHRDYSILGTDIMVKIFDHHYIVESPGILPGLVRIDNIRQMHFSRNPKIAEFMQQYKLVKEFGEGVDRMFREMAEAGNPAPEYKQIEFMVKVRLNSALRDEEETTEKTGEKSTLKSTMKGTLEPESGPESGPEKTMDRIIQLMMDNPYITSRMIAQKLNMARSGISKQLNKLQEFGLIRRIGPNKGGHWEVIEQNEKGGERDGRM